MFWRVLDQTLMFIMTATQSFHFHRHQLTLHVSPFLPLPLALIFPAPPYAASPRARPTRSRYPINALTPEVFSFCHLPRIRRNSW